ncbi:hypothetical protein ACM912_003267 [Cronobacter sakazakii]|uniref:hypothetical protein n=1 Tax=Cronobacter sakazakii TaxID=28141 RepID=UPI000976C08F|nr:hypothetical protein [Cronobacter sakazakii]EKK4061049.1 hypothetical protein [Cronobacter sakazakii]ELY2488603.1 hypothetical protein [Cronobacter sakazakii]ELY2527424.1 hypothetical protein [Cronobacter sakazakii]ELY3708871.1 hypothetical protein [Cronobacter sakazakii]ELY4078114.1 hypothetical protein [Cronobacter sakazakii]
MELTEKYAVWYSTCATYELVQNYFSKENGTSKFEKDFGLKNRFIDYDHAISIWYGKEHGELGYITPDNPAIDNGFLFISTPIAERLYALGVEKISYIFAMPDFEYDNVGKNEGVMIFLDNIICSRKSFSWVDDILNDM